MADPPTRKNYMKCNFFPCAVVTQDIIFTGNEETRLNLKGDKEHEPREKRTIL